MIAKCRLFIKQTDTTVLWFHAHCKLFSIRYRCTEIIIRDQGREFVSHMHVNQNLFTLTKTNHRISSTYHPQTNGLVERFNQTIQRALLKLVKKEQNDWDQYIDGVLFGYRTAVQKSTQKTPFEVMYLR